MRSSPTSTASAARSPRGWCRSALIESADRYEPAMQGMGAAIAAPVAGPDLLRAPDGTFLVLEDNMRAPSGLAYLLAARGRSSRWRARAGLAPRSLEPALDGARRRDRSRRAGRRRAARESSLVNDGPRSGAGFEHADLARRFGMSVAAPTDLRRRGERLLARRRARRRPLPPRRRRASDRGRRLRDGRWASCSLGPLRSRLARLRQLARQRHRRRQGDPRLRRGDDRLLPR